MEFDESDVCCLQREATGVDNVGCTQKQRRKSSGKLISSQPQFQWGWRDHTVLPSGLQSHHGSGLGKSSSRVPSLHLFINFINY